MMQARLWIARGEPGLALQWARQRGLMDKSPADLIADAGRNALLNEIFQSEYLNLIRLALAQHQPARAIEMITLLQTLVEKRGHQRRIIELSALKALALHQNGEVDQALQALGQALSLGEPEGYQRTFVDEGEPMARLLYIAVDRGISPAYAGRLLAVLAQESQVRETSPPPSDGDLIEPLSARELEVLALLSEGLTNGEIAGRLYISLSTVKGHTANIFGKLGVNNRTQAVARARTLGLLGAH